MLVASIDGGKHILQNDMFKFWEYGRKLATGVQKITDSLKDVKRKRGQKSFWGNFEREQTLQKYNVISGIEDPNLKRQSKGYRDEE